MKVFEKNLLIIIFVIVGIAATDSQKANAGCCESGRYEWVLDMGWWSQDGDLYHTYYIKECGEVYVYHVIYYWHPTKGWRYLTTTCGALYGPWPEGWKQSLFGSTNNTSKYIEIIAMDNLQIKLNTDVVCDIYEVGTGRLILGSINISANSSFNTIDIPNYISKSSAYCIVAKNSDKIIANQIFYFNNQNQIIKGVTHE